MAVVKTGVIYASSKSLRSGDVTQTEGSVAIVTLRKVGVHASETERYPSTETEQLFRSAGKFRQRTETMECRLQYPDVPRNLTQITFKNYVKIVKLIGL